MRNALLQNDLNLLHPAEAAEVLGCAHITVRRLMTNGDLPSVWLRRKRMISVGALKRFIRDNGTVAQRRRARRAR